MAKNKDNRLKATASDSNYTSKAMTEFTMLNNDELKAMEQIMAIAKSRAKLK